MEQVQRRYLRLKRKVQTQLQLLQEQRAEQLAPSRVNLPDPWQPIVYEQPVTMYKVVAAQGGLLTSVYDSQVVYQLQEWTHARAGCSSKECWPPLWSCMYAFPTADQARNAVFPRGSQQQKGARVLCHVSVQGKGYCHPDGRVAVSHLRLNAFMEYLPKGPSDKVVALRYDRDGTHTLQTSSSSSLQAVQHGGLAAAAQAPMAGSTVLQLTPELQEVAWDVEAS